MRKRKTLYKWQRARKQEAQRRERVKRLKAELQRVHWLIGRLGPQTSHSEVSRLRKRVSTIEQQLRYIGSFEPW